MNAYLKKTILLLFILLLAFSGCGGNGGGGGDIPDYGGVIPPEPNYPKPPSGNNQTMMQAFYWEMNTGIYASSHPEEANLWSLLANRADELANIGITTLWLPPANKGANFNNTLSAGYDTYDLWDLGEFNQKGFIRTKYGTKAELMAAINTLHGAGIKVYYDAVLNHRMGADYPETVPLALGGSKTAWTGFTFPGRNGAYYNSSWDWHYFNCADDNRLFQGKSWNDSFDVDYIMGSNVDYSYPQVVAEINAWGRWIINDINFDGFRLDAVKHISSSFTGNWINYMQNQSPGKNVFFVGEAWYDDKGSLKSYLTAVNNNELEVFDFPLRAAFAQLSNSGGSFNMAALSSSGLANDPGNEDRAVTFVDNHDLNRDGLNPGIVHYKYQDYAYILLREHGIPCVFWKDFYVYGMKEGITRLIKARKFFAYGPGYEVPNNDNDVYSYVRAGDGIAGHGLVMMIADGPPGGSREITKNINSQQPNTTFYDYTGHFTETVTTNGSGYGDFKVKLNETDGWSIWVPVIP